MKNTLVADGWSFMGLATPAQCTHVAKHMAVTPVGLRASGVAMAYGKEKGSNPIEQLPEIR